MSNWMDVLKMEGLLAPDIRSHGDWEAAIQVAQAETALSDLAEDVDTAYLRGELTRAEAEALDRQIVQRGKDLCGSTEKNKRPATTTTESDLQIWAEDLLSRNRGDKAACWACGQIHWWFDCYGNRKCGVCHPNPRSKKTGSISSRGKGL